MLLNKTWCEALSFAAGGRFPPSGACGNIYFFRCHFGHAFHDFRVSNHTGSQKTTKKSISSIPKQYHIQSPVSPCDRFRWHTAGFREFPGFRTTRKKNERRTRKHPDQHREAPGEPRDISEQLKIDIFKIFKNRKISPEDPENTMNGVENHRSGSLQVVAASKCSVCY